jgi:serine/threonine protein kinase, bacterial
VERRLGSRYTLQERIGQGATGEVWRASVRGERPAVAVKVLRADLRGDPEIVRRFLQERAVMVELRHPNVVSVRDLVVEGDRLAIVMDLVDGHDLRDLLRREGTLPPALACLVASQVAEGLAAAHAAGVVHRDLKPENVLLGHGEDGGPVARVTDFGLAKLVHATSVARLTQVVGTPGYMAPELAGPGPRTAAIDVYALGVLLYELLAGRRPFDGDHPLAVLRAHVEQAPDRPPGLADELWDLIAACLAKDPSERPPAATLVARLASLGSALDGLPALPAGQATPVGEAGSSLGAQPTRLRMRPGPEPRPATTTGRRALWHRRGLVVPAVVVLVVLAGAGLWVAPGGLADRTDRLGPTGAATPTADTRLPGGTTRATAPGSGGSAPEAPEDGTAPDGPGGSRPDDGGDSEPPSGPPTEPTRDPPEPTTTPSRTHPTLPPPAPRDVVMYSVWGGVMQGTGHPHSFERTKWAGQAFVAKASRLRSISVNLGYDDGGGTVRIFLFHHRHDHDDLVATKVVEIVQNGATVVDFAGLRLSKGDRYIVQVYLHENGSVYFHEDDLEPALPSYVWCPGANAEACRHPNPQDDMNMHVVGQNG